MHDKNVDAVKSTWQTNPMRLVIIVLFLMFASSAQASSVEVETSAFKEGQASTISFAGDQETDGEIQIYASKDLVLDQADKMVGKAFFIAQSGENYTSTEIIVDDRIDQKGKTTVWNLLFVTQGNIEPIAPKSIMVQDEDNKAQMMFTQVKIKNKRLVFLATVPAGPSKGVIQVISGGKVIGKTTFSSGVSRSYSRIVGIKLKSKPKSVTIKYIGAGKDRDYLSSKTFNKLSS